MRFFAKILLLILLIVCIAVWLSSTAYTHRVEAKFPAKGELINVNGAKVHVLSAGNTGTPILMIHGAGANAREFEIKLAPRLSDKYRVFMVDRPGHGYSERVVDAHELGVQAAQMASTLDGLVPGEKAIIVGHSFGAPVSLRLAMERPDLVKAVVLLAPVAHDWGPGKVAWYNYYATIPVVGYAFSQLMPLFGPSQARSGLGQTFAPALVPEGYYEDAAIDLMFRPASFRANAQDLVSFRSELIGQQSRYDILKMPVIVISGTADKSINSSFQNNQLKQKIQNIEIIEFENEGHVPHYRRADEVVRIISKADDL